MADRGRPPGSGCTRALWRASSAVTARKGDSRAAGRWPGRLHILHGCDQGAEPPNHGASPPRLASASAPDAPRRGLPPAKMRKKPRSPCPCSVGVSLVAFRASGKKADRAPCGGQSGKSGRGYHGAAWPDRPAMASRSRSSWPSRRAGGRQRRGPAWLRRSPEYRLVGRLPGPSNRLGEGPS